MRSGFGGQLPQPFTAEGSRGVPRQAFNDMNREEMEVKMDRGQME